WMPTCGRCRACRAGKSQLCEVGLATIYGDGVMPHGEYRIRDADGTDVGAMLAAGTFAEFALVDESATIPIDSEMPLDQASIVGCAVATGAGAVMKTAAVPAGAT